MKIMKERNWDKIINKQKSANVQIEEKRRYSKLCKADSL